jgi:hypothetical protein
MKNRNCRAAGTGRKKNKLFVVFKKKMETTQGGSVGGDKLRNLIGCY